MASQSSNNSVSLQLDLVALVTIPAQRVLGVLEACAEDDIQGLVLPPLEAFGRWILVDSDRIRAGEKALQKSESRWVQILKLSIGLSGRGLTKALRDNIHLTAAFLFAVACSTCFAVEDVGMLIHQMMALQGMLNAYPIHSTHISQFVRNVTCYGDVMEGIMPSTLYSNLARAVGERLRSPDALPGLFDTSPIEKLARILHKVFEELQNMNNRRVTMEGCRSGIWLATVLLWLRPKEADLSIDGFRIFPQVGSADVRLSINLVRHGNDASLWHIYPWHPEKDLEKMVQQMDDMVQHAQPHNHYPLGAARTQMSNAGISLQVLEATGHLAAALVDVAYEQGYLRNSEGSSSRPLQNICSDYFQNSCNTIIERFGWGHLDRERKGKIAAALKSQISKARGRRPLPAGESGEKDIVIIETEIRECERDYYDICREALLVEGDNELSQTIERAVHLATEALLFSFCFKRTVREIYRPLTTTRLDANATILRKLLFSPLVPHPRRHGQFIEGYAFWEFRKHAIEALLQGALDIKDSDIAVASNGYVAYSAALLDMDAAMTNVTSMTDERKIPAICVVPGALRVEGEQGRIDRITEAHDLTVMASRSLCARPRPLELFSSPGQFCGLDEAAAVDRLGTAIEHLVSAHDDVFRRRVLYLTTFLKPLRSPLATPSSPSSPALLTTTVEKESLVPTSWQKSIDALTFARHVWQHTITPALEKSLAQRWSQNGVLEVDHMQWCPVGQMAAHKRRAVSTTSLNEPLRFFEAGNLAVGRELFVRQKQVPLIQCIKEAMETCEDDPDWAIIS